MNIAFTNANVITVDDAFSIAEAIWIKDQRIVFVGEAGELSEQIDNDTRVVDVAGRTIMPGFVDTRLTAELGRDVKRMIQPEDVAAAIDYVLASSPHCCPTEIVLRPQQAP